MELQGKTINFLGDSITEGHGTSCEEKRFSNLIKEKYGLLKANNYGISGTRIAKQKKPSEKPSHDLYFCGRLCKMDKNADAVVVFGGTNDYGHGDAPFGQFTDRTDETFYGACHVMMSELASTYVGKPVVIVTPLHRTEETRNGRVLENYVNAIKEVARYYSLPVLDLYASSGIQPSVPTIREKLCPDGLHPNDEGHTVLAEKIANFLKTV